MNISQQDLAIMMAEKTDQQLLDMFTESSEWTPESLDAAKAELGQRMVPLPSEPAQQKQKVKNTARSLCVAGGIISSGIFLIFAGNSDQFFLKGDQIRVALIGVGLGVIFWGVIKGVLDLLRK